MNTHFARPLGIEAMSYSFPGPRRCVADWIDEQGMPDGLAAGLARNGASHYHSSEGLSTIDLAAAAVRQLFDEHPVEADSIDLVIFTHTLSSSVAPPPASVPEQIRRLFGLRRALAVSVAQQNCASYLASLKVVEHLFSLDPRLNRALIVSADKVVVEKQRNLSDYAMQSDGAAASLISRRTKRFLITPVVSHAEPQHYQGASRSPELMAKYSQGYALTAYRLLTKVRTALANEDDATDDTLLIPSNLNRPAFEKVADLLAIPHHRLYTDNIATRGHAFCSDAIINLTDLLRKPESLTRDILVYASGNSGCFSAMALTNCRPCDA